MTDLDIQELANLTAGDADVDNFERLFTKLKEMKGKWKSKKQNSPHCTCNTFAFELDLLFSIVKICFSFSILTWR